MDKIVQSPKCAVHTRILGLRCCFVREQYDKEPFGCRLSLDGLTHVWKLLKGSPNRVRLDLGITYLDPRKDDE